jgi:hypothetical protein
MGSFTTMPRQAGYASIDRRQKNKSLSPGIEEPDDMMGIHLASTVPNHSRTGIPYPHLKPQATSTTRLRVAIPLRKLANLQNTKIMTP